MWALSNSILNVEQCLLYNLEDAGINVIYSNSTG